MRELDFDFFRERLSPEAMQILSASIEESRQRNHNFLSEDHILLALCKKERKLLQDTVCRNALRIEDLTEETQTLLDSTKPYVGRSLRSPQS
jgi:ATP-dependent Clp protease ATP-binding subunit ClpA